LVFAPSVVAARTRDPRQDSVTAAAAAASPGDGTAGGDNEEDVKDDAGLTPVSADGLKRLQAKCMCAG